MYTATHLIRIIVFNLICVLFMYVLARGAVRMHFEQWQQGVSQSFSVQAMFQYGACSTTLATYTHTHDPTLHDI